MKSFEINYIQKINLFNKSKPTFEFFDYFFFGDLTCGMCYRLDLHFKSFTGTALRQQMFYRNGVPDRSSLLSPLVMNVKLKIRP